MDVAIGDRQLRCGGGLAGWAIGDLDVHATVSVRRGWASRVYPGMIVRAQARDKPGKRFNQCNRQCNRMNDALPGFAQAPTFRFRR